MKISTFESSCSLEKRTEVSQQCKKQPGERNENNFYESHKILRLFYVFFAVGCRGWFQYFFFHPTLHSLLTVVAVKSLALTTLSRLWAALVSQHRQWVWHSSVPYTGISSLFHRLTFSSLSVSWAGLSNIFCDIASDDSSKLSQTQERGFSSVCWVELMKFICTAAAVDGGVCHSVESERGWQWF